MPTQTRREFLMSKIALGVSGFSMGLSAAAQTLPEGPVKVIVPYGAGGLGDYTGRLLSQYISQAWSRSSIVENKAGASGLIGSTFVKNAKADGNTILMTSNTTISAAPYLFKNLSYDPAKDFVHLGILGVFGSVALVRPDAPFKTLPELVAYAAKHPDQVFYAYTNTSSQVPAAMLQSRANIKIQGVPYKETGRAISDLMAGQVQLMFMDYVAATPHIAGGKVIPLAVTQLSRAPQWPQVPAVAEFFPGFELSGYVTVSGPAGMPKPMVETYNALIRALVADTPVRQRLEVQGVITKAFDLKELDGFIRAEASKWVQYVAIAGIQPE